LVTLLVTPIGGDYRGEMVRQVDIRVLPPGVIVGPNRIDPKFVFPDRSHGVPDGPVRRPTTTDNGVACGSACTHLTSATADRPPARTTDHEPDRRQLCGRLRVSNGPLVGAGLGDHVVTAARHHASFTSRQPARAPARHLPRRGVTPPPANDVAYD
jgi:hypothetical protein